MTEGLVPSFSLNSFPVVVLDRKAERAWLRWPGGRLDSAARLRGPTALPVDWSRYSFLASSVAPGSHLLPPDVWAQTGSPLLALDCSAPLNSGGVGDLQGTLVHEGFHLYYQRVGWEDMSAMAPPGSETSLVPNRSALRLQLEQHFREPRYATALFAEITALRSARSHFGAGHTAAGLAALHNFLSLRRDRRRELSLELFFGEDYWEYTEGVAYFVEQLYRRTVPGLVPPRVDLGEGVAPGYFIDSGALIAAALECWEPGSLLGAISPGRPLNLTRLLASRVEGRTRH